MKLIFLFLLMPIYFVGHAQEMPAGAKPAFILYPEVYQIITLDKGTDFQLSILENICLEQKISLIMLEEETSIMIAYPNSQYYEKNKEANLEKIKTQLENTSNIKNSKSYGREYLPSEYWKYI